MGKLANNPFQSPSNRTPTRPTRTHPLKPTPGELPTSPYYPVYSQPVEHLQPVRVPRYTPSPPRRSRGWLKGCFWLGCLSVVGMLALSLLYLLAPLRTNLLILGIDRVPEGTALGRSDTMILVSVVPLEPTIKMLSIPRDLWVMVPGVGEQRINTAHFFAEAEQEGAGPAAALRTVEENFNVKVPYFLRVRFDSFSRIIDALGGVTVDLPEDMSGYAAGAHHLNSEQALAFVRDRKGSDDFFRMERAQLLIRAVLKGALQPSSWSRLPEVFRVVFESVDTNLPPWELPRLGLALLRAGPQGIDSQAIGRELVTPVTTEGGANVLVPDWALIRPLMAEMFGP